MPRDLVTYVRWRYDRLAGQLQLVLVLGPPFIVFLIGRAFVEGELQVAIGLVGLLCAIAIFFFYQYMAVKAYRAWRWRNRSQRHLRAAEHRARVPEPWNRPSSPD